MLGRVFVIRGFGLVGSGGIMVGVVFCFYILCDWKKEVFEMYIVFGVCIFWLGVCGVVVIGVDFI